MIITDAFVWINFPKTGSTFAREVLRRLYFFSPLDVRKRVRFRGRWMKEQLLPETRPAVGERFGTPTPHGRVVQIPAEFRDLPVVSALRDPVARAYSLYMYGDWKKHDQLPMPLEEILESFPSFPRLSFEEYLTYIRICRGRDRIKVGDCLYELGTQSVDFLNFFAESIDSSLDPPHFKSWESLSSQLAKFRFLNVSSLNQQLATFLRSVGFSEEDVRFIDLMPKINESSNSCTRDEIRPLVEEQIKKTEWLLDLYQRVGQAPSAADLVSRARKTSGSGR